MWSTDLWTSLNDTCYADDLLRSANQIQFKWGLNVWFLCNKYFSLRQLITIIKSYIYKNHIEAENSVDWLMQNILVAHWKKIGKSNQHHNILSYFWENNFQKDTNADGILDLKNI